MVTIFWKLAWKLEKALWNFEELQLWGLSLLVLLNFVHDYFLFGQFKKLKRELKQLRFEFDRLLVEQNKTEEEEEEEEHVTGGGKRPCRYCKRHHHQHHHQQQQQQHHHHSRQRISGVDDCCCACFDQSEPEDTDLDYIHRGIWKTMQTHIIARELCRIYVAYRPVCWWASFIVETCQALYLRHIQSTFTSGGFRNHNKISGIQTDFPIDPLRHILEQFEHCRSHLWYCL